MSQVGGEDLQRASKRELILRLIRTIEGLSCEEEENAAAAHGGIAQDRWSETKMKFMRKYGHMV